MDTSRNPIEDRVAARLPAPGTVWLHCRRGMPGRGTDLANGLLDLSEGGLQFLSREPLAAGELVEITLGGTALVTALRRAAEVRWVVELGAGACCVGVRLLESLTAPELAALLGAANTPEPAGFLFDPLDDSITATDLPLQ